VRRNFLKSKIHRAVVTRADPDYEGSISIDPELLKQAEILPFERVEVYNISNGNRFATYAIVGESGEIGINGAAAHLARPGDLVIIAAYCDLDAAEIATHQPRVVLLKGVRALSDDQRVNCEFTTVVHEVGSGLRVAGQIPVQISGKAVGGLSGQIEHDLSTAPVDLG
jgi:aspartate 1-decarboxylase